MFECNSGNYTTSKNNRKQQKTGLIGPCIALKDKTLGAAIGAFGPYPAQAVKRPENGADFEVEPP